MTAIHRFATSGEAYDHSQADDRIRPGDVLYVPSETSAGPRGSVAVLMRAWPVAVNAGYVADETGRFDSVMTGATVDDVAASMNSTRGEVPGFDYAPSLALARLVLVDPSAAEVQAGMSAGIDYR